MVRDASAVVGAGGAKSGGLMLCTRHRKTRAKPGQQCFAACEAEWGPAPDVGPEEDW